MHSARSDSEGIMNEYRSRPLNFPWPPLIYALAAIVAYGVHVLVPVRLSLMTGVSAMSAGALLLAAGLFFDLWALKTLHDRRTTVLPNRCAAHLVTSGPYRFSRNPVYLGYTLSLCGLGLMSGIAWLPLAAFVSATTTYFWVIRREEKHLLSRFGCDFERYRRTARCWI